MNLRDSGCQVVVGNREDEYRERARQDGFETCDISEAVAKGDIVMLLPPDEELPRVFAHAVAPYLRREMMVVFASGYAVAFDRLKIDQKEFIKFPPLFHLIKLPVEFEGT